MIVAGTHVGRFWVAGAPENVLFGRFIADKGQSPLVEVFGEFTSGLRPVATTSVGDVLVTRSVLVDPWDEPELTIHGDLFQLNERVTLVHARPGGRSRRHGGRVTDPGTQVFSGRFAVIGGHVDGPDQQYTGVRLRVQHLDEWAWLGRFASEHPAGDTLMLSHRFIDVEPATSAGGAIVDFDWTFNVTGLNSATAAMTRNMYLRVRNLVGTWPELDRRVVTPVATLLTLAIGHRADLLQVDLQCQDDQWVQVVGSWGGEQPSPDTVRTHNMLAPRGILTLGHVARWLDQVETLGPLPPVVAHSVANEGRVLETEVLELCTVAEGLHSRLYPGQSRLGAAEVLQARDLACDAASLLGAGVGAAMRDALAHFGDLSYPTRIKRLGEVAERSAPGITGRSNRWKSLVVESRNTFAHRPKESGFLTEGNLDGHITVMLSLQWVLRLVLLSAAGISDEALAGQVSQHQPYRLFIDQARRWSPRIYDSPEQA